MQLNYCKVALSNQASHRTFFFRRREGLAAGIVLLFLVFLSGSGSMFQNLGTNNSSPTLLQYTGQKCADMRQTGTAQLTDLVLKAIERQIALTN